MQISKYLENKTLLFIQIKKTSIVNYNMAIITAKKITIMRKKIISGGCDLYAVFFSFENEILFSDSLKIFLLSRRRTPIFTAQTAKPQDMFWRHLIEFHST